MRRLQTGRNYSIAPDPERATCPGQDQIHHIAIEAQVFQIVPIQTRQGRYGQNFYSVLCFAGGAKNVVVPMHGRKINLSVVQLLDRAPNRFGHIKEFEIDKNFLLPRNQPFNQLVVATGHENLESQLVDDNRFTKLMNILLCFVDA